MTHEAAKHGINTIQPFINLNPSGAEKRDHLVTSMSGITMSEITMSEITISLCHTDVRKFSRSVSLPSNYRVQKRFPIVGLRP
ncbi:15075_t:CDS:2 [Acaulospora morrowiae]|uniref:15075_t:CDS:1 n=1 Tax=Acaulospora morrowiae TaxID=94023 RepID=A0A9N8Z4Y1_9GLOM|nr:15075_t:CDS:2 [Acaulospora morrowiae]